MHDTRAGTNTAISHGGTPKLENQERNSDRTIHFDPVRSQRPTAQRTVGAIGAQRSDAPSAHPQHPQGTPHPQHPAHPQVQRTAGGTAAVHHTVKKKKKSGMSKGTAIRLAVIAALVLLLIITIIVIAASNKVKVLKYYEIEAGSEEEISPSRFLKK